MSSVDLVYCVGKMNVLQMVKQMDSLSPRIQALLKESNCFRCNEEANDESPFSRDALKARLSDLEFRVTQNKETEKPFSGKYVNEKSPGIYKCVVCSSKLFSSEAKFFCSCGWPAFNSPIECNSLTSSIDLSSASSLAHYYFTCGPAINRLDTQMLFTNPNPSYAVWHFKSSHKLMDHILFRLSCFKVKSV
ncbi:unnamed protein product [Schistosoma spindalis]|nr:unnamed protein product [Schistosoma spindale]